MVESTRTRSAQFSGLQVISTIYLFIFLFLTTHEVSIEDSVKLCATLLLDVVTGGLLWVLLSKKSEYSVFEFFGVGVALGTSINTVAQLLLRTSVFGSVFNIYFGLFVIALFILRRNKKLMKLTITQTDPILLFGLLTISLVMICGDRYYIWPGAIILGLSYFLFQKAYSKNRFPFTHRYFPFIFICVAIFFALFASSVLENILFGQRTTISYIGGWDGFVIEANRKSIMNFGPFDNILVSNTKYAYYWFHDAWSGSFTQRARVGDWIVTTQFGFIVSAVASLSLLTHIIIRYVNRNTHVILVLWLVSTLSLIGSPSNVLYLGNFSQIISILWICWIFFLLNEYANSRDSLHLWLLTFAGTLLVMTKITAAVPVIGGILFVACLSVILKRKRVDVLKIIFFSVLITVTSLSAYVIFIKPAPAQRASYSDFSFNFNNTVFGISSGYILVDLIVVVAPMFTIASLLRKARQRPELLTIFLCSIAALSLILSTSMSFVVDSPNTYLFIPFIICFALAAGIEISKYVENYSEAIFSRVTGLITVFGIGVGFFCGLLSTFYLNYWNFNSVLTPTRTIVVTIFPLVCALSMALILISMNYFRKTKFNARLILTIALLASTSGSYVAHSLRSPLKQVIFSKNNWDLDSQNVELKYLQLNSALQFVEMNSTSFDVIASNSTTDQGLIAAVTGVRNFATSYIPNFWGGVSDRYFFQSKFGRDGSFADYDSLRQGCVTWFYVDKNDLETDRRSWEPYAMVQYEDEFGAVLKMSNLVKLPSNC
ncbi:unannotated protein [freshwater metagenome]|uniref:Unannotated protein n=1 Tax=freshwater metagenome TaxID=449393 RepID=A0A6J6V383_9ZZZZ